MSATISKKINVQEVYNPFKTKSYKEILRDLIASKAQAERGEVYDAGAVVEEIRTQYGLHD